MSKLYLMTGVSGSGKTTLSECLACPDFVDKAQDDLESFYKREEEYDKAFL